MVSDNPSGVGFFEMKSKQRRKANRNFIQGAKAEIRVMLGKALMSGGIVQPPSPPKTGAYRITQEFISAYYDWQRANALHVRRAKKMLAAGLIDRAGRVAPKGFALLKEKT